MKLPDVILLNGASCAGKTSIARGLQAELAVPFIRLGVDDFIAAAPPAWLGRPGGVRHVFNAEGRGSIEIGEGGLALMRAYHRAIAGAAGSGTGVIVDEVLCDPRLLPDWLEALASLDVFFVGVTCSVQALERRERARSDRADGTARSQHKAVHAHREYDLVVDTTAASPDACVDVISEALARRNGPGAFQRLRRTIS